MALNTRGDKTVLKSLALGGLMGGGGESMVDVKDGRVIRVRPFRYDWHYDLSKLRTWKFEKNGKVLTPNGKGLPGTFSLGYKKRTYSPNRVKYPIIRVDWDPTGERNPQNRGKSKFRRATWDEVTTIIAAEIMRIHETYGPYAILMQGDGHGECKLINTPHGQPALLLDKIGGFTLQVRNPDSWEGWYWGSKHVWGQGLQGMMWPAPNIVYDSTMHAEVAYFWGGDPETTCWGFTGQFASRMAYFWRDIGIKAIYVCPEVNYGAAVHADKWVPVIPNTDAALQLAILYVWITEGTYDKEYVKTHCVGMEQMEDYVMGRDTDHQVKTPAWAAPLCGVPEYTIKALARYMAKYTFCFCHYFGGSYARGPWSSEPARLECIMLGMHGLGRPGVHQHQFTYSGMPRSEGLKATYFWNPTLSERLSIPVRSTILAWTKQIIPKTLIHKAIQSDVPIHFMGNGGIESPVEDQFVKYTYPIPAEDGGSEIHMIWTDTPCRTTCWNCGNETELALRNPKIETVVAQHPWLENDCLFADIVLPSNTSLEVDDIMTNIRQGIQIQSMTLLEKAIEPLGESKSDYEIVAAIAAKMGLEEIVTEGKTIAQLQEEVFHNMGMDEFISWEEFKEKKYYLYPVAEGWENDSPGFRKFYEDPENNPLPTPTGKLEFYSQALADHFPNDLERPPIPKWIAKSEMHDERREGSRGKIFPLVLMSNHGRWRVHSQADDIPWTRELPTCKITGFDGYKYEPVWLNPQEAEKRGIKNGDIVEVFNERGIVLCGAYVTERLCTAAAYVDHGARVDSIIVGQVDRGGAINTIAPDWITSKNCVGQATSGYLVDVRKLDLNKYDQWKRDYPEVFARAYDPASGLRFEAWIEGKDVVPSHETAAKAK